MPRREETDLEDSLPSSTHELLQRYLHGDRAAERRLFEGHRAVLLEHVRRRRATRGLRAEVTPEDITDEVFLRALSSGLLSGWNDAESGALRKALFHITGRVIADMYRRRGTLKRGAHERTHAGQNGSPLESVLSAEPTPTSNVRTADLMQLCQRVLEPREWEVFRMRQIDGIEPSEIAHRIGESPAAVRGVWHRARLKVADALASYPR